MPELAETMSEVSQMIDAGTINPELLGDLELGEVVQELAGLVSGELMHLGELGEDAEANEIALRGIMQTAAFKAFFSGLYVGSQRAQQSDSEIVVQVPPGVLEAIGIAAIRDNVVTFHLVTSPDDQPEQG